MRPIKRLASQRYVLKESAVVTSGFESPPSQIQRNELRRGIQSARRRVAAFHFVGSNKVKIAAELSRVNRIYSARGHHRCYCGRPGFVAFALGERDWQRQRKRKQDD